MRTILRATGVVLAVCLGTGAAQAECSIEGSGSVRILGNDFEAIRLVVGRAQECESDAVTFTANMTTEHKNLQVPALTTTPSQYSVAIVASNSVVPLLNEGLVRPLDELIAKYGQELLPSQLIQVDGKTVAVAFMANAMHQYYRTDILAEAGLEQPRTVEDVLEAARIIREKGILEYPFAGAYLPGFYLGNEFVGMYIGHGGEFFQPGSAAPAINNAVGIKTLETMKALTEYMDPEFMTFGANELRALYESGNVAMMNMWGSFANTILTSASPEIVASTVIDVAPSVDGNANPAAALWWDGFTIAKNISEEDAAVSFQAMVHGIDPALANANPNGASWITKGYEPGPYALGVMATIEANARPYPTLPTMQLMHTALGAELAQFMKGEESAEQALADAEAAYIAAAREAGFLQ